MGRVSGFLLAVAFCVSVRSQDGDKLAKLKAPDAVSKAVSEVKKQQGYHMSIDGFFSDKKVKYDGVVKKDLAAFKGDAEVYMHGTQVLVKSGDRFVSPNDAPPDLGPKVAALRHPSAILSELSAAASGAKYLSDENGYKVIEIRCTQAQIQAQIKEFASHIKMPAKAGNYKIEQYLDASKSTSVYTIHVGTDDLMIHKLKWDFKPAITDSGKTMLGLAKKTGMQLPVDPDKLDGGFSAEIKDFNKDLEVDLPKEVKSKLGV